MPIIYQKLQSFQTGSKEGRQVMYERAKNRWFKHMDFMILDLVVLEITYLIICYLRMKNSWHLFTDLYRTMRVLVVVFDFLIICTVPVHKNILKRKLYQEYLECIKNVSILVVAMLVYLYLMQRAYFFSRPILITFWVVSPMVLCVMRSCYKKLVRKQILRRGKLPRMMLIANSAKAETTMARLKRHSENRFVIRAIVLSDEKLVKARKKGQKGKGRRHRVVTQEQIEERKRVAGILQAKFPDVRIFQGSDSMYDYLREGVIDEVMLDLEDNAMLDELIHELMIMGLTVHINLAHTFGNLPNELIERVGGLTVLTSSVNVISPIQTMLKRAMDIAGSLVGLMITAVAFVIFAPIIYIQSPGPIFYSQWRIGKNGRRFRIFKFRSMYPDADKRKAELMEKNKMNGLMFKMDHDPRIIPIGHFMRKLSIDELPQFFNILKGDMSLVGTRPPTVDEWEHYSPHHRARLCFKPGLTGLWQVSGRSDITDFEEVVMLDMQYIREWSLSLDIRLLLKTVKVVLQGRGSV